jgi:protein-tyrosine phosphatase
MNASKSMPIRILFVCMGNICRSPTAEGVFAKLVKEAGLEHAIASDSAGTADYHVGEAPDPRACASAAQRGYDLKDLRARQVARGDFEKFDYVLAMDEQNLWELKRVCPPEFLPKLHMFTEYASRGACDVPDPYYGGPQGFEAMYTILHRSCEGFLEAVTAGR